MTATISSGSAGRPSAIQVSRRVACMVIFPNTRSTVLVPEAVSIMAVIELELRS
jgi:hypothetical protein